MTKENPLNARVGDIIELYIDHYPGLSPFNAKITKILERYRSDLITFDPINPTEHKYFTNPVNLPHACDVHFISKIIKRAPYKCAAKKPLPRPKLFCIENYFAVGRNHLFFTRCSIYALLELKNIYLEYGLREIEEIQDLWYKSGSPGRVNKISKHSFGGEIIVRRKPFAKWLLANLNRITRSRSRWLIDEEEIEKKMEKDYFDDLQNLDTD